MPAANPACGLPWTTRKVGQFATVPLGLGVFGFLTSASEKPVELPLLNA